MSSKLVFIYGPPAVGKLTVAGQVAALTGYRLFHNHVTVNMVRSVFPQGSASFATVLAQVRLAVFREAARADLPGLIFTMVYTRSKDAFIAGAVEAMEIQDGQVCFVRLTCAPETLEDRVRDESRQHQDKLTTSDSLRTYMAELADQAPWAAVRGRPSLSIDTDALSPRAAAEAIVSHYGLARFDGQPSPGGPGGVRT